MVAVAVFIGGFAWFCRLWRRDGDHAALALAFGMVAVPTADHWHSGNRSAVTDGGTGASDCRAHCIAVFWLPGWYACWLRWTHASRNGDWALVRHDDDVAGWHEGVPRLALFGAGALGGLVQGVAGVGGPPVVAIALSRPGRARQQRANIVGVMTAIGVSAFLPLWWFGLFTSDALVIGCLFIPAYAGGTWLGSRQFLSAGECYFRGAALAMLGSVGLELVIAVRDYIAT